MQSRRPSPSVLVLAFLLCLAGFGERELFALGLPVPQVRFDQTVTPPDVPPEVLIGEDLTFRVRFKNVSTSGTIGYGPFIDLVLDAGGANITKPCPCDGISFVQANMISVNGGPVPLVSYQSQAPCVALPAKVPLSHPFANVLPVLVPAGSQLVTLELPFGSFDPTQPEVVVEVKAHASLLADVSHPLKISARGGFRYGTDALDNAPPDWPVVSDLVSGSPPADQQTDSALWSAPAQAQTTPTVMTIVKKYLGPEDETATGPNFPQLYQITLDIATGQTVSNVIVTDHLPNNMTYVSASAPPCFTVIPPTLLLNDLILKCPSITGVAGPDAIIVFKFFIPQFDLNGQPVLSPTSCAFVQSVNDIKAEGDWTPVDPCDTHPAHVVSDVTVADHTLQDKCMAIQKTATDVTGGPPAHPIPGDTLEYKLNFQLSDFKTAGNLKIQDILSDGQTLLTSSLTLTVTDQCGTTTGTIPSNAWSQTTLACGTGAPPPRTELDIDVSKAMMILSTPSGPLRHQAGILTGGYALSSPSPVPATGTITFRVSIDDQYHCPVVSPHDIFVDKDDPLTNTVTMAADILTNGGTCSTTTLSPAGFTSQDDSKLAILIATDFLSKTVYAVVRGSTQICGPTTTPCPSKPDVMPFDQVTFRLLKTIPSSDAENLTIQDWLPLPKFLVAGSTFSNTQCGIPNVGASCLGPSVPALSLTLPVIPIYSVPNPPTNSFLFTYGTFNDPTNQPRFIDLLFTRVVTNTPAVDGLYVTNEARECESNSFGVTFCQNAIAQVHVREPALKITKGIVAATNPNAVFSPPQVGPVSFHPVGTSCPRFNGTINSTNVGSTPINSDISNIDANDCVTFAIVVENTGGSPAYDIKLREIFPPGPVDIPDCFVPDFTTLCVTDGTGASIPFTTGTAFHANLPIALQNPLPGVTAPAGSNLAVITFDACVVGNIKPHCCDNVARLENYASTQGGQNFVDGGFGGPFQDSAQLCVRPQATKSIKTTSEVHTPGTPSGPPLSQEQLAIGEVIRYRLQVIVPESSAASTYVLTDQLPAGLQFLNDNTARLAFVSNGTGLSSSTLGTLPVISGSQLTVATITPTFVLPASAITPGSACGSPLTPTSFDLGNLTNSDNDADQELIVLEFNALACNGASNQNGTLLDNSFGVVVDGQQMPTSNTVTAVIVEPNITITKAASVPSLTVGAVANYTVTLVNNGTATAFDVHLIDQLPACLTNLSNVQANVAAANSSTPTTLDLTIASIPVFGTATVHYSATLSCVDCTKLTNTATVTWTSLPGLLGTTSNPTTSPTPGGTGQFNGERNGSGGVNDYVSSASATVCCLLVSNETINCNPNGTFTYTFTVTNFSNANITTILFLPTSPANVTITPPSVVAPLSPGASTTVTVTIGGAGAVSGTNVCFSIALGAAAVVCRVDHCVTLPNCCVAPPSGMVAWYPLDETQGATAVNDVAPPPASSVNNVGTPKPAAVGAILGPIPVAGQVNGAIYFSGGYVEVPPQNDLNFGGGSFSIDAWVRDVRCVPTFLSPIADKLDTGTNTGFVFYVEQPTTAGVGLLKLRLNGSTFTSTGSISATAAPISNTGPWFHIAVTFDVSAALGTFYINGSPAGTFTASAGPFTNTVPMWIGKTRLSNNLCEIAVDELEIFNRALTLPELTAIYNAGSAGKCLTGQLCLVNFDDLNRNGVQDAGEPLLPGWTFKVTDQNGALVGTITSGTSPSCLTVSHPGRYTISGQFMSGWAATTLNPQTVTLSPGQTLTLSFGNRLLRRPRAVRH
jgi:uncharacterized repeat protein (TIGR01451 family)/fimbrial isopeptide formation D2 family protein